MIYRHTTKNACIWNNRKKPNDEYISEVCVIFASIEII